MARLATWVHVIDDGGRYHVFGPGDEVPEWAASRITNPAAWAEPLRVTSHAAEPDAAPVKKTPVRRPRKKVADG